MYALYNKNKPKSDALMAEYGAAFFRVRTFCILFLNKNIMFIHLTGREYVM